MRNDGRYLARRVLIAVNQVCVSLCVCICGAQGPEVILHMTVTGRKQVTTGDL